MQLFCEVICKAVVCNSLFHGFFCVTSGTQLGRERGHRTEDTGFQGDRPWKLRPRDGWQRCCLAATESACYPEPPSHPRLPANQRLSRAGAADVPLPHCVWLGQEDRRGQWGAWCHEHFPGVPSPPQIFRPHHPELPVLHESPVQLHQQHAVCGIPAGQPAELPRRRREPTGHALWLHPLSDRRGGLGAGLFRAGVLRGLHQHGQFCRLGKEQHDASQLEANEESCVMDLLKCTNRN